MNLFEKAHEVFDLKYCSVVKDGMSGCTSEYLVLIAFQDFHISFAALSITGMNFISNRPSLLLIFHGAR